MKTWEEAITALRAGKRVRRNDWEDDNYIYKYEDCLLLSNNRGLVKWAESRYYPNHNDWIIL